jgi:hypothetical protein
MPSTLLIDGHLCHWIEFKNYFGFKSNPLIASKNKKQLKRYASEIGSGAVVYRLGFEIDHIVIAVGFIHFVRRRSCIL